MQTFVCILCRLKASGGNKTTQALLQLGCSKRILLTGTPVQNNLEEFYALLLFVTPDLLGSMSVFKRVFGDPITISRDKAAGAKDREIGKARAIELQQQVDGFLLRRTQAVLSKHLPPLAVYAVFCKPSPLQLQLYQKTLKSKQVSDKELRSSRGIGRSMPTA